MMVASISSNIRCLISSSSCNRIMELFFSLPFSFSVNFANPSDRYRTGCLNRWNGLGFTVIVSHFSGQLCCPLIRVESALIPSLSIVDPQNSISSMKNTLFSEFILAPESLNLTCTGLTSRWCCWAVSRLFWRNLRGLWLFLSQWAPFHHLLWAYGRVSDITAFLWIENAKICRKSCHMLILPCNLDWIEILLFDLCGESLIFGVEWRRL